MLFRSSSPDSHFFGDHIIAVRLKLLDDRKRPVNVLLVSAYFPIRAASQKIRHDFYLDLERCVLSCAENETLLLATDSNLSLGTRDSPRNAVLGPFGVPHRNKAGTELYQFCSRLGLCSPTSFFQKPRYATWRNPRTKLEHQIDTFVTQKSFLSKITDAQCLGRPVMCSGHNGVLLTARCAHSLWKRKTEIGRAHV